VIAGFELARFEPYRGGEMFPMALLEQPGVDVFIAQFDGEVAGACVTVVENGFGSHYWVGTPPAFRSPPRVAGIRLWTAGSARASNAELALDAAGSRCLPSPS